MQIDSHQHFWKINDTDYVWMNEAHASIQRDFLPRDLEPLLRANHLDGTIAVQARQMLKETQWLLELSEQHPLIRGVVGWVPLAEPGIQNHLDVFASHPKLVGVRHVVHDEPDDNFILRKDFNEGVSHLKQYALCYDVLIFEKHLPQTIKFVDRHPNQPMVVDHIAKPVIQRERFDRRWAENIRILAQREHVCCKLSGLVTEVRDASWDASLLLPYFETVLEAFGADRLLFGSDWPVCLLATDYDDWARTVRQFIQSLSSDEQAAIMGGNTIRFYGLSSELP